MSKPVKIALMVVAGISLFGMMGMFLLGLIVVSAVGSAAQQVASNAPITAAAGESSAAEHYVNDVAPDQVDTYAGQFVSYE